MKSSKYFAKWLMVILIMAIGIGTFGALYIGGEKEKETTEARPSSYLTNQRKHDIDMKELALMTGEFEDEKDRWELEISEDYGDKGPYLSLENDESGDTGFEGRIMYLKEGILIVEIDEDLYKGMPDDWEPEGEGKYAILDYSVTDDGITLGYRGAEVSFDRED